jgi:hypothetical protein
MKSVDMHRAPQQFSQRFSGLRWLIAAVIGLGGFLILSACSDTDSFQQNDPTTRALADPMGYSNSWDNTSVTGGGTAQFDPKAFKKDVNDVVNP